MIAENAPVAAWEHSMSADVKTVDTHETEKTATSRTGFGTTANAGDKGLSENSKDNLDEKLDNGVNETFPGSDPVSVKITK